LRTKVTKGAGSKKAALAMAYKLLHAAEQRWRRLNGHELVADVLAGARFKDGILIDEEEVQTDTHDDKRTRETVAVCNFPRNSIHNS
jgi:putative transposase